MIGVYYPYLASAGIWEELRYSLRSLEKFLDEEFEVWIVGDLPDWIDNVHYIGHRKLERIPNAVTFDAVKKLEVFINEREAPEKFIRMYDDVYLIGHRSLADLKVTRYLFSYEDYQKQVFNSGSLIWRGQVNLTMKILKGMGYKGFMTETHCPEVFERGKMEKILKMFHPAENRLLTSTLYYNVYPYERMVQDWKTERALFYGHESDFSFGALGGYHLDAALKGRYFLNHNDEGLTQPLKKYIEGMFPEKSRFEI